jgi:hypothetical protein
VPEGGALGGLGLPGGTTALDPECWREGRRAAAVDPDPEATDPTQRWLDCRALYQRMVERLKLPSRRRVEGRPETACAVTSARRPRQSLGANWPELHLGRAAPEGGVHKQPREDAVGDFPLGVRYNL